jgi:hypothetical protein
MELGQNTYSFLEANDPGQCHRADSARDCGLVTSLHRNPNAAFGATFLVGVWVQRHACLMDAANPVPFFTILHNRAQNTPLRIRLSSGHAL